jgi:tetratricopeptide (TPR) repeat protein
LKSVKISIFAVLLLLSGLTSVYAEEAALSADDHVSKAEVLMSEGRQFQAVKEFREALQKDDKRPEIHGYLSVLLYNLGFLDDAIEEMRKAVDLYPDDVHLNMELGRLYFVRNNPADAMEQFFSVLEMNPGHASAYYYLGELFLRMKEYDMAWLSARMASRLGHKGQDLIRKLRDLSEEPKVEPWKKPGTELYIRQILVNNREKAEELVRRLKEGELFEDIAAKELTDKTAEVGGFLGKLDPADVHPDIARELLNKEVLSPPFIVETEKGYHIVQRVLPFDFSYWEEMIAAYNTPEKEEGEEGGSEPLRGKGPYLVYAGSFKSDKNAMQRTEDLKELGFPSYYYRKGTWLNVVAGRYESYQEALEAGKELTGYGYEYYIPQ